MHDVYGVDLEDRELLASRSFRWLVTRIKGVANAPAPFVIVGDQLVTQHTTRLSAALADD